MDELQKPGADLQQLGGEPSLLPELRLLLPSMGNHGDKPAPLSYAEVPTADPDPSEDTPRIGVSYVFATDDDDDDEEESQNQNQDRGAQRAERGDWPEGERRRREDELPCAVYHREECVYEKQTPTDTLAPEQLIQTCRPGDLVEFVGAGQYPHWVVYVGGSQVVHLHRAEVKSSYLSQASQGKRGRVVSEVYRFRPLNPDVVVQKAMEQVGIAGRDLSWRNSECFAAWCKFGRREFKMGGELRIGKQPYRLMLLLPGKQCHVLEFQSLEDLVMERRRNDQIGKVAVIQELATHLTHDGGSRGGQKGH